MPNEFESALSDLRYPAEPLHPAIVAPTELVVPLVVVAEDDEDLRAEICAQLELDGFEVVGVRDGDSLVNYLGACEYVGSLPDVVVSDNFMPGYSGFEVLETLFEQKWTVPVVLISGYGDPDLMVNARAHGAKAFLKKPLDFASLRRTVYLLVDWSKRTTTRAVKSPSSPNSSD